MAVKNIIYNGQSQTLDFKGAKLIDLSIKLEPVVYSNIEYRTHYSPNGDYIDGIHKEVYNMVSQEVINMMKENYSHLSDWGGDSGRNVGLASSIGSGQHSEYVQYFGISYGLNKSINYDIANEILELAKEYCPVETGTLRDSGCLIAEPDGSYSVAFLAEYAWFVHEFTWNRIISLNNPNGRHKFLEIAVQEVLSKHNLL